MDKKTIIRLILSILLSTILIAGITYAIFNYTTEKTNIIMNIDGDQINFNAGLDITVNDMLPVNSMEEGIYKDIEIYKENGDYEAGINLFLNLKTWPVALSDKSFRWALYKNDVYFSSGDFSSKKQGNTIQLTTSTQPLNLQDNSDTYRLYLWIDAHQESNIKMMNKSFVLNVYGQVSFYDEDDVLVGESTPNAPELADGMIPIKYNYLIDEWQKADVNNIDYDWYNYDNKIWANAVMVTESSRNNYMNASVGTTINEDDILAYYVWIPRYRYVLFNVESRKISPQEIQIEFQETTDTISNGTQNGEYLTHPAFWWDEDSDGIREEGEELSGIWVGKFELAGTETSPLIKPNIIFAEIINKYRLFNSIKIFQSVTYLTSLGVIDSDFHMIKNTEWGSIIYLSHSRYGANTSVCMNNSTKWITGRSGAGSYGAVKKVANQYPGVNGSNGGGYYTYNDFYINYDETISINKEAGLGQCASTTGNVSGIYDMGGCRGDLVMSFQKDSTGNIYFGNSGFNISTIPDSKYYDLYEYGNATDYSRRILGDSTGETLNWYGSDSGYGTFSTLARGGRTDGLNSQIFSFLDGWMNTSSSRAVLVLP